MTALTPEELLTLRFSESLELIDDADVVEWVKARLFYGGCEDDMRFSDELISFRNQIRKSLDVEPLSVENLGKFLVSCIGRRILILPSVRELLLLFEISKYPERKSRLMRCFNTESQEDSELIEFARKMNWRAGSNLPKKFLHEIRLPISLANSPSTDSRQPMELIHPYRQPLPLLPFQNNVKERIISSLGDGKRSLVVMPTGSGKTRTAIQSIGEYLNQKSAEYNGILWLADRDELCEQAAESFASLLPFIVDEMVPLWRYWGGREIEVSQDDTGLIVEGIVITSHQQISRRMKEGDPIAKAILDSAKIVIIDEAHRWLDWNEALGKKLDDSNPLCKIVGLTATPFRRETRDNSRLLNMYDRNLITPFEEAIRNPVYTLNRLMEEKVLATRIDLQPGEIGCGFAADSTPMIRMNEGLRVIEQLIQRGSKSIIVFTESVAQAKQISVCLSLKGIAAAHLDSNTPPSARRRIIQRFRNGEITVLLNYMILTTGFDSPAIDSVVILRKYNSEDLPVIQQMIGRGLRGPLFGGTNECIVISR